MSACFDKVAIVYGVLEKTLFGSKLQEMRCRYLNRIENSKEILLVGEGCGFFLIKLLEVNSEAMITVVEPSKNMIRQAESKVPHKDRKRVAFCNVALGQFSSTEKFDAICTFFFWDCFRENQMKAMFPILLDFLRHDGSLINVDFAEPSSFEGRRYKISHFILLRILYGFFGLATGIESTRVLEIEPIAWENGLFTKDTHEDEKLPFRGHVFRRRFVQNES